MLYLRYLPAQTVDIVFVIPAEDEAKLALLCLQQAADYNACQDKLSQGRPVEDIASLRRLELEYLSLRTSLVSRAVFSSTMSSD